MYIILVAILLKSVHYPCRITIGPIAAYYLLKRSRIVCIREKLNANQIMFIRYLLLFVIVLFLAPFQHFHEANFEIEELFKILVIAVFLNIIPLYCSQSIALLRDHNYVAKLAALLPLTIFVLEVIFFTRNVDYQELLLSVVLIFIMFIFLKNR